MQFINAAFYLILNIYMAKNGYSDPQIANFISFRFLAVVCFAFPFGFFIKGKKIRPVFWAATISLPLISLVTVQAIEWQMEGLLKLMLVFWGIAFSGTQITTLPYILRNATKESHTAAFSLHFATWSIATIFSGLLIFILSTIQPEVFTDKRLLQLFGVLGFVGVFFVSKMSKEEVVQAKIGSNKADFYSYDWFLIFKTTMPTLMIAIGAGLTIPFINLFFYNVFDMDSDQFSLLGAVSAFFVAFASLMVPYIKHRLGYEAITLTQTLSILVLILLGTTEFLKDYQFAYYLAILCFIVRQPLMNLANPLTSEMVMYYVGKKNQEMTSAVISSIWSGSWFFSSQIFRYLRSLDLSYGIIFYITSFLYICGAVLFYLLILEFRKIET